jgi:hypothetical protein
MKLKIVRRTPSEKMKNSKLILFALILSYYIFLPRLIQSDNIINARFNTSHTNIVLIDTSWPNYFAPNNTATWIYGSGIFNGLDMRNPTYYGFEWPKGSGKFAIFSTGLSIGCYITFPENPPELREAMCSFKGEYAPGWVDISYSLPVAKTDSKFRFYRIRRGDNMYNNPDWINWSQMVPFGAPFVDVNHNGVYEYFIDTPGVRSASVTIFICLTDGFPEEHKIGEGFGGGTKPIYAEMHWTAWGYDNPGLEDIQFMKFDVVNKSKKTWDSAYFAITSFQNQGNPYDDYIGCDTLRKLGYCYNASNYDSVYGYNPPASGIMWLNCGQRNNVKLTSFSGFKNNNYPTELCGRDTNGEALPAYYMLQGLKNDRTPWVIPNTSPPQTTKYCYSGDPETGQGWTEYTGFIRNCGGLLTGELVSPAPPGDRFFILGASTQNHKLNYLDTAKIVIAQLVARGTNNKNSVTKLKQLADVAQQLCNNGFVIGIEKISTNVPKEFALYQNYPNPFNPSTKIKFSIPLSRGVPAGQPARLQAGGVSVRLTIYNLLGQEITTLVNDQLKPGTYEVSWDGTNYPSGVYYYKLSATGGAGENSITKKMILIK